MGTRSRGVECEAAHPTGDSSVTLRSPAKLESEIPSKLGRRAAEDPNQPGAPCRDPWVLILLGAAFLFAALSIDRGWIPHDDGFLGQAAVRALTGELPHRDFHDMYTGALSYWHALSFVLFGIHLMSPRILLLLCFAGFLAATYQVARRFAPPRTAAAVVVLCSVWSLPNYPAAMPTWYNLFLAVTGLWFLFRYLDSGHRGWLLAAGAACGVSIVVKIVGLYTMAACLMVLALIEARGDPEAPRRAERSGYTLVLTAGLGAYVLLVLWLVRAGWSPETLVHFVLPSVSYSRPSRCAVCGCGEFTGPGIVGASRTGWVGSGGWS